MKSLFLMALFITQSLTSAGDEDYEAMKILSRNCSSCHQTSNHPGALFLNEARLSQPETLSLIRRLLETEQMPHKRHRDFRKSLDGEFLLKWLQSKEKAVEK